MPCIIFTGNYLEAWQMADKETGHEEMNFESALENYLTPDFGDLEEGSITKGTIVRINGDNVLVDVEFQIRGPDSRSGISGRQRQPDSKGRRQD